jgi:hypothetical protein
MIHTCWRVTLSDVLLLQEERASKAVLRPLDPLYMKTPVTWHWRVTFN